MSDDVREAFRRTMTLEDWLENVFVCAPGQRAHTTTALDWYAVCVADDGGIVAIFRERRDAEAFRLQYITTQMHQRTEPRGNISPLISER